MIYVECTGNRAWCTEKNKLTSGLKGAQIRFSFSSEWRDLLKMAVLQAYDIAEVVPIGINNTIEIPEKVLARSDVKLVCGAYGIDSTGNIVIPTVYAELGTISRGASPRNAENYDDPSPLLTAQILELTRQAQYAAAIAVSGAGASQLTFTVVDGHLFENRSDESGSYTVDLGAVSAYAIAKAQGYEGTEAEFAELLLAGEAAMRAAETAMQAASSVESLAADANRNAADALTNANAAAATANALNTAVNSKQAKHKTGTVTLDKGVTSWTKSLNGVTASNSVIVTPAPSSYEKWNECGVRCTGQTANKLTFKASDAPDAALVANVIILD